MHTEASEVQIYLRLSLKQKGLPRALGCSTINLDMAQRKFVCYLISRYHFLSYPMYRNATPSGFPIYFAQIPKTNANMYVRCVRCAVCGVRGFLYECACVVSA